MIIIIGTTGPVFKAVHACMNEWIKSNGLPYEWCVRRYSNSIVVVSDMKLLSFIMSNVKSTVVDFDGLSPRAAENIITDMRLVR